MSLIRVILNAIILWVFFFVFSIFLIFFFPPYFSNNINIVILMNLEKLLIVQHPLKQVLKNVMTSLSTNNGSKTPQNGSNSLSRIVEISNQYGSHQQWVSPLRKKNINKCCPLGSVNQLNCFNQVLLRRKFALNIHHHSLFWVLF